MSTLYLHIGLPKTGSTFLQEEVFPLFDSFEYLYKPDVGLLEDDFPYATSTHRFMEQSPVVWRDLGETLFHELFGPAPVQGKNVLLSDEGIGNKEPVTVQTHLSELNALANQWGFTRVRAFGSVRHQASRMASSYAQGSERRLGASQRDFEERARQEIGADYYQRGVRLEYDLLWQSLTDVLGEENVLLLPYELMKNDLPDFLERWFIFLERQDEGDRVIEQLLSGKGNNRKNVRSVSSNTWALRKRTTRNAKAVVRLRPGRLFNALGLPMRVALRWPDLSREDEIRLTPSLSREIMQNYEKSNRAFAAHIDMDLSPYGYY